MKLLTRGWVLKHLFLGRCADYRTIQNEYFETFVTVDFTQVVFLECITQIYIYIYTYIDAKLFRLPYVRPGETQAKAELAKKNDLADIFATFTSSLGKFQVSHLKFLDHVGGLKKKNDKQAERNRKHYQVEYWKPRAVEKHLVSGGHGFRYSKVLSLPVADYNDNRIVETSAGFFKINPSNADEFEIDKVTKFVAGTFIAPMRGWLNLQKKAFEDRRSSLNDEMVDHPKWGKSQGVVSSFSLKEMGAAADVLQQGLLKDSLGCMPWTRIFKNNTMNVGPQTGFVPGTSGMFFDFFNDFYVVLVPLQAMLDLGVTPQTFPSYVETKDGEVFFAKSSFVVRVKPQELLYVPCGFYWSFFHIRETDREEGLAANTLNDFDAATLHRALRAARICTEGHQKI